MEPSLFEHLESLGVSFQDSRAVSDYKDANSRDELHYAAGKHLALHAALIRQAVFAFAEAGPIGARRHEAICSCQVARTLAG